MLPEFKSIVLSEKKSDTPILNLGD